MSSFEYIKEHKFGLIIVFIAVLVSFIMGVLGWKNASFTFHEKETKSVDPMKLSNSLMDSLVQEKCAQVKRIDTVVIVKHYYTIDSKIKFRSIDVVDTLKNEVD